MSKFVLTFGMFILLFLPSVFAQTLQDYVLETRGDTLVVKDDNDFGAVNTLYSLLNADTLDVPAGRVYLLHNAGVYTVMNNPTTVNSRKVIIMGETQTSLKINKGSFPAILQGGVVGTTTNTFSITSGKDLLLKNVDVEIASTSGSLGWAGLGTNSGTKIQVDNCIIEHNQWVCTNAGSGSSVFYTNDYFVNLDGHTCRRNGGVIDFFNDLDTVFVENCTHINTQGTLYKYRQGHIVNRSIYNHNDFVNCSGSPFMNYGGYSNFSLTNNIFVNSQVQPFAPILFLKDSGEIDLDTLAMGLVNIYVDSTFKANGASFYADRNLTYWDPTFDDMIATLNASKINGETNWQSQRITMNSRTKALFADKTNNPKLTNGTWFENVKPTFKNTDVLFTTQLAVLKAYSLSAVDTSFTGKLASWRQASNAEADYFCYADWPIPVDFSYTDTNLLTAGLNGFPVGDLNWFPTQNTVWKAQESTELEKIANVLATGTTAVEKTVGGPQQFQLQQNYPNPFNPTTVISYSLPKAGYVSLKVYNMLGQEVATLVNSYKTAQTYSVQFDASKFASGVYIYSIKFNNQSLTHKMVLMK
jgi:hypothetical protein